MKKLNLYQEVPSEIVGVLLYVMLSIFCLNETPISIISSNAILILSRLCQRLE